MLGVILTALSSLFAEIGSSIGKVKVAAGEQSIYTMAFLNFLWGGVFLAVIAFGIRDSFLFSLASLPTFIPRAALEILQLNLTMRAVVRSDRSTFGFIRTATIPLLLLVDLALGYTLALGEFIGLAAIAGAIALLFANRGIRREGAWFVAGTSLNAVATISLYKYDITRFNSVEGEQIVLYAVLLLYSFLMARLAARENPFALLARPAFLAQSAAMGVSEAAISFAYLFAPASVITAAKRATGVLFAVLSGNLYFREKRFLPKALAFAVILLGLAAIALAS